MKRSLLQVVGSIQCLILNTAFKMAASPELLTVPGTYEQSATIKTVEYGVGSLSKLPEILGSLDVKKPFILTGHSIRTKTPLIQNVLSILERDDLEVFSGIRQHAPIADIRNALAAFKESGSDGILAIGGGSPIDSGKLITSLLFESSPKKTPMVMVPTTLSVAETTPSAGVTNEQGQKVGTTKPDISGDAIIYDGAVLRYTPLKLALSSGMRAVDHAIETLYADNIPELPYKPLALSALQYLTEYLPKLKDDPENAEIAQILMNAGFLSLFPRYMMTGAVGLSHSLGHGLGAAYGIPHGITSCVTLAPVVHFKAEHDPLAAKQLLRILPFLGIVPNPKADDSKNAHAVGDAIAKLVDTLGLTTRLTEYNVPYTDAEKLALHGLGGDKNSPLLSYAIELVQSLY
ncbi:alcohol dehydrogenase-8 [Kockiozyma suomiensis]|uniref:alcohol dehydrogenase-8 n=1 Tax=Kockiozyma suomiensis TaxID=1337062 RepID=UPI003343263F